MSTSQHALADLLDAEAAVFLELADLAARQRAALLEADTERLNACTARAETLATRFRFLEVERTRLEAQPAPSSERLDAARRVVTAALGRLLHETQVSSTVLERLEDSIAARQAAVGGLFGATYLPDGRAAANSAAPGRALCAEG